MYEILKNCTQILNTLFFLTNYFLIELSILINLQSVHYGLKDIYFCNLALKPYNQGWT